MTETSGTECDTQDRAGLEQYMVGKARLVNSKLIGWVAREAGNVGRIRERVERARRAMGESEH